MSFVLYRVSLSLIADDFSTSALNAVVELHDPPPSHVAVSRLLATVSTAFGAPNNRPQIIPVPPSQDVHAFRSAPKPRLPFYLHPLLPRQRYSTIP